MMESTDGALATKKQPVGLPLWRGGSAPQAAPGRHSPLLDDRPLPPSPPPHEPLQPVRRAWGGGAVPLVAGSPLPDMGAFSYSSYPSTLPALGSPIPEPQQQKEDEEKTEKDEDEPTSNYKKEEEVGWISVESAHVGAIAPLPPSPRPPQAVEEEKEGEAHNAPGQELPRPDLGSPVGGTASRPTSTGVAAGSYDIAISAPFDFPRDDTQGFSTFAPSYAGRVAQPPGKQERGEQEHSNTALWSKVALLPAGLLSHSVELLGNRSDTLGFAQAKPDSPNAEIAAAFPGLPRQFEGSARVKKARPPPPDSSSRRPLSVTSTSTTLGDYALTPEDQAFWLEHERSLVLAQSCIRRRQAMRVYPRHRKRHRIALELWTTEQTYIKALQQCTQIRKRLESHQPKPILSALEIKTIFSETETILLYATVLEGKLRQQLEHWHVDQTLAHVFTEIQPYFKVYNRYMIQYNASLTAFKHALQSSSFQQFLEACAEDFVHTDLPSILIMPVQRIPRYILLLDALVAHTPTTHIDYADLCQALDVMKRFTESANQTQRNYERYQAILRLHELLQPQIPNLVVPSRVFQGAGSLLMLDGSRVMRRNQRKVRQVFLFNDLLVVTKHLRSENKYHLKVLVFLASVQLDHNPPVPGEEGERCFLLRSRKRPEQSLLLEARSMEDKMAWVIAIERATYLLAQPRTTQNLPS